MSMNPSVLIMKKRSGTELTEKELRFFIKGIVSGEIPDYQASAFLMATFFKGMTTQETVTFTKCMLESGHRYDFGSLPGIKVDKHSTGGIGDKVSIILAPLAASCGLKVPMMAGRGLGHTGGTIDKLEAIEGFNVSLNESEFHQALKQVGTAIIAQTPQVAPADKKLYALRDVTGTVECMPLIVGSILSKKLAEGANALIMDIKVGNGAFMKNKAQAKELARNLISVSKKLGLQTRALLTNMDQPLGVMVGNSLEIIECIEMMRTGKGAADLKEITLQLCAQMLELGKIAKTPAQGRKLATENLENGKAYEKFIEMVKFQNGSIAQIQNTDLLPVSKRKLEIKSTKKGHLTSFHSEEIGRIVVEMGGGRKKTTDPIHFGVGLEFHKKLSHKVSIGETLVTAYLPDHGSDSYWNDLLSSTMVIQSARKTNPKLVIELLK